MAGSAVGGECEVCGGPIRSDSKFGICKRNPECAAANQKRRNDGRARARSEYMRGRYAAEDEKAAAWRRNLWSKYKVTPEWYARQLARQEGACAICGKVPSDKRLAVDHNHACCDGERTRGDCMRGLLCDSCNRGLGHFKDDAAVLASALAYLRQWGFTGHKAEDPLPRGEIPVWPADPR